MIKKFIKKIFRIVPFYVTTALIVQWFMEDKVYNWDWSLAALYAIFVTPVLYKIYSKYF